MNFIYIFSQFTNELLIFEALLIFVLLTWYAAHYILVKRKMITQGEAVPAGVVKIYLNELIGEAQSIREQLFGLIGQAGITVPSPLVTGTAGSSTQLMQLQLAASAAAEKISDNPALQKQLATLQAQLAQQLNAIQQVEKEKRDLEAQLSSLKSGTGKNASGAGSDSNSAELDELKKRVKSLQERLDEYSVIEDDLANLKRLQQENESLKAQLTGAATSPKPIASTEPAVSAIATASAVASTTAAAVTASTTPSELEAPASNPPAPLEGDFEGLVDKVEESLAANDAEPSPTATANTPANEAGFDMLEAGNKKNESPAAPAPSKASTPEAPGKSDEDLLSEFEKMLNM